MQCLMMGCEMTFGANGLGGWQVTNTRNTLTGEATFRGIAGLPKHLPLTHSAA